MRLPGVLSNEGGLDEHNVLVLYGRQVPRHQRKKPARSSARSTVVKCEDTYTRVAPRECAMGTSWCPLKTPSCTNALNPSVHSFTAEIERRNRVSIQRKDEHCTGDNVLSSAFLRMSLLYFAASPWLCMSNVHASRTSSLPLFSFRVSNCRMTVSHTSLSSTPPLVSLAKPCRTRRDLREPAQWKKTRVKPSMFECSGT